MSGSIPAGSWQRTGEYHTRGVPVLHGLRWQLPLCVKEGVDPEKFYPVNLLQQDGILYVTYEVVGGESACCAIEAQSGTLCWRFTVTDRSEDLPDCLREAKSDYMTSGISSMVLTATTAFVGTMYGVVYGLDLRTGQPIWKMDVDDLIAQLDEEAFGGLLTDLEYGCSLDVQAVIGNILLVAASTNVAYASSAQGICGIDIAEQTCLWHERGFANGPLTLWDQMLYGCEILDERWESSIYYAYDWYRQQFAWHSIDSEYEDEESFLEGDKTVPIVISMDGYLPLFKKTLYVIGREKHRWESQEEEKEEADNPKQLIALDAQTGEIRWTCSLPASDLTRPDLTSYHCFVTVANGLVYLSRNENRCAVDLETHQLRWCHLPAPTPPKYVHSSPVLADGLWYECREDGVLLVLDALTGEERWRHRLDGSIERPCLVHDGMIYVIAGTTLYALH